MGGGQDMDHYGGSLGHLVETQSASTPPQLNQAVASGKCMALCLHTCPKEVLALRATPRIRLGDGTGDTGSTLVRERGLHSGKDGSWGKGRAGPSSLPAPAQAPGQRGLQS